MTKIIEASAIISGKAGDMIQAAQTIANARLTGGSGTRSTGGGMPEAAAP